MTLKLTPKIVAYVGTEEGLVPEAYLDPGLTWTFAMGIATTSGFNVLQYKDKPQPLDICLRASITYMQARFLPAVEKAFAGHDLTENQIAAALSFHWNTGAITTATWVHDFLAGKPVSAKADIMNWSSHGLLTARRERERDLFFDATWPADLRMPVYQVAKPSYRAVDAKPVDVVAVLQQILGWAA